MSWLSEIFRNGFSWIRSNPVLLFLILLILLYNHFYPDPIPKVTDVNVFSPASLLGVLDSVYEFVLTTKGQVLGWSSLVIASALTMFNTGALFAVFSGRPTVREGIRFVFSDRLLEYVSLQLVLGLAGAYLLYLELWIFVYVIPSTGVLATVVIFLTLLIGYPMSYMVLSTGALLSGAKTSVREKGVYARVLLRGPNLKRLLIFYGVRIGLEILVAYAALAIGRMLHVSLTATALVIVLLTVVPFAWVRTTGFVLKLGMLRDTRWFSEYFSAYYRRSESST